MTRVRAECGISHSPSASGPSGANSKYPHVLFPAGFEDLSTNETERQSGYLPSPEQVVFPLTAGGVPIDSSITGPLCFGIIENCANSSCAFTISSRGLFIADVIAAAVDPSDERVSINPDFMPPSSFLIECGCCDFTTRSGTSSAPTSLRAWKLHPSDSTSSNVTQANRISDVDQAVSYQCESPQFLYESYPPWARCFR